MKEKTGVSLRKQVTEANQYICQKARVQLLMEYRTEPKSDPTTTSIKTISWIERRNPNETRSLENSQSFIAESCSSRSWISFIKGEFVNQDSIPPVKLFLSIFPIQISWDLLYTLYLMFLGLAAMASSSRKQRRVLFLSHRRELVFKFPEFAPSKVNLSINHLNLPSKTLYQLFLIQISCLCC